MPKKESHLTFRIESSLKKKVEAVAKQRGYNTTAAFTEALEMWSSMDESFYQKLKNFSAGMGRPLWLVLQNLTISWMARKIAEAKVYGLNMGILYEFKDEMQGVTPSPVTGDALEDSLVEIFTKEFEQQLQYQLETELKTVGFLPEDEQKRLDELRTK